MKKQFLLLYTLLFSITGFAQQEPLFTQYKILGYTINPAMAGSQEMQELRLGYRSQWRNFPGAPTTATISFQGAMDEKSAGGILAFTDIMGPTQRSGLQLSYAFHVPIGQPGISGQTKLSFGLGGKVLQYHFRAESTYFQDRSDPAIMEAAQGMVIGDAAFDAVAPSPRLLVSDQTAGDKKIIAVELNSGDRTVFSSPSRGLGEAFDYPKLLVLDAVRNRLLVADSASKNYLIAADLDSGDRSRFSEVEQSGDPIFYPGQADSMVLDSRRDRLLLTGHSEFGIAAVDLSDGHRSKLSTQNLWVRSFGIAFDAKRDVLWVYDPKLTAVFAVEMESGVQVLATRQ